MKKVWPVSVFIVYQTNQAAASSSVICKRVWLGLWNSHLPPEPDSRDEQKVKDFLIKKYEKKTYYVPPDQVKPVTREKEKEKVHKLGLLNHFSEKTHPKYKLVSKFGGDTDDGFKEIIIVRMSLGCLKFLQETFPFSINHLQSVSLCRSSPRHMNVVDGRKNHWKFCNLVKNSSPSSLGSIKQPPSSSTQPVAVAPPPGPTIAAAPAQPKKPSQDLLSDLGGDPFGAPQQPQANAFNAFGGQSQGAGGFADFGQAFGGGGSQTSGRLSID
ncbi:hypothetical protein BSL78_03530 [Apostichopus japonicus]|uniref:Uncharacterized protein n=1 Tax=Stichopus japonicus TaxID=307972 RepID=A0A2G8LH24_STIJA|nr:hypothetical protein BSL78_03530 [Apostichopus japonicus]